MFADSFAVVADEIVNERGVMFNSDEPETNNHSHFNSGFEFESLIESFECNDRKSIKSARMGKGMRDSLRRG